jgi:histidyl-tRNA synthetase
MIVLEKTGAPVNDQRGPDLFIAAVDEASRRWAFTRTEELRRKGFAVETDFLQRSLKSQMREANRQRARWVMVIGETELQAGTAQLKNMLGGEERTVSLNDLESALA